MGVDIPMEYCSIVNSQCGQRMLEIFMIDIKHLQVIHYQSTPSALPSNQK
jgi:hypothetical protein